MRQTIISRIQENRNKHGLLLKGNPLLLEPEGGCAQIRIPVWMVLLFASLILWGIIFSCLPAVVHAETNPIVKIAITQLGLGEEGGDNEGKEVLKYTRGKKCAWCAAYVSWVLYQLDRQHSYFLSARSYWKAYRGPAIHTPRAGDIIVFARGPRLGHVGIVEGIKGNRITTIEGNVGKYPAKVREFHYTLGNIKNLLGFVRVNIGE